MNDLAIEKAPDAGELERFPGEEVMLRFEEDLFRENKEKKPFRLPEMFSPGPDGLAFWDGAAGAAGGGATTPALAESFL